MYMSNYVIKWKIEIHFFITLLFILIINKFDFVSANLHDNIIASCASKEKDRVLGLDRSKQNKVLLIGYVTGAARQPHSNGGIHSTGYKRMGSMISGSLSYAIHLINNLANKFNQSERERLNLPNPPLPEGYQLDFCYFETYGNESESIRAVITLVERVQVSAIIGPQETCNVEAAIATTYNIPMLSYYCDDAKYVRLFNCCD